MENLPETVKQAHLKATEALKNSYAPYSGLHVACAIKAKGLDHFIVGVNVENASYGGTICAERSALVSLISQFGNRDIEFVVVISDWSQGPIPPCGLCLQALKEFVGEDCPIYLGGLTELSQKYVFKEFLPLAFSSKMLPGKDS